MTRLPIATSQALLLVSGCSGRVDRNRSSVDAAGSCSRLSDCMSLSAHQHLICGLCLLAWCSTQCETSGGASMPTRTHAGAEMT